jgi:biopolymer transport protein ExbB
MRLFRTLWARARGLGAAALLSAICFGQFALSANGFAQDAMGEVASANGDETANETADETADESGEETASTDSVAAEIPTRNLLQMMHDGGPMMYPIAGCSFLLLIFVFERAISLRRGRVIPRPFVKRFLEQLKDGELDRASALALCEDNKSPVADVFAGAIKKWGRPAVEVEQAIIDAGERIATELRRYLRLMNGISTMTPLMGLLGTVMGMISCFNVISKAAAMGRSDLLANGISEALLTTAAGLLVAIPALAAYLLFVGRVDRLIIEIDALGQQVVGLISAESLSGENSDDGRAKRRQKAVRSEAA